MFLLLFNGSMLVNETCCDQELKIGVQLENDGRDQMLRMSYLDDAYGTGTGKRVSRGAVCECCKHKLNVNENNAKKKKRKKSLMKLSWGVGLQLLNEGDIICSVQIWSVLK